MGRYGAFKKVVQGRIEKFGSKNLETVLKGSPYKTPGPLAFEGALFDSPDIPATVFKELRHKTQGLKAPDATQYNAAFLVYDKGKSIMISGVSEKAVKEFLEWVRMVQETNESRKELEDK